MCCNALPVADGDGNNALDVPLESKALSKLDDFVLAFRFTANVSAFGESNCVESSSVLLREVSWKIKLCKRKNEEKEADKEEEDSKEILDVFLVSAFGNGTEKWSCEAQASFTLLQKDEKTIQKKLTARKFSNSNLSFGIENFISWDKFIEDHVEDNKAAFEIELTTNPLKRTTPMKMQQVHTRMHISLQNVSTMKETYSPEMIMQGVRWRVHILNQESFLAVFLKANDDDIDLNWVYDIEYKFKILNYTGQDREVGRKDEYSWTSSSSGFPRIMPWTEFIDKRKGIVVDDKANILVEFKVNEPRPMNGLLENPEANEKAGLGCKICFEKFGTGEIMSTECGHLFCKDCYQQSTQQNRLCPVCKQRTRSIHPLHYR